MSRTKLFLASYPTMVLESVFREIACNFMGHNGMLVGTAEYCGSKLKPPENPENYVTTGYFGS